MSNTTPQKNKHNTTESTKKRSNTTPQKNKHNTTESTKKMSNTTPQKTNTIQQRALKR
jgi:hypothetical protein